MKTCLLIIFSLLTMNLTMAYERHAIWKIKGYAVWFIEDHKNKLRVSKSCGLDFNKAKCLALLSLKKLSFKDLREEDFKMGKNPSSALCTHSAKGEVSLGRNSKRQTNSFCLFKDGSVISADSLTYYAILNDQKGKKEKK